MTDSSPGGSNDAAEAAREQALACARALVPKLRQRADRCAELRCAPPETIADLQQARLLRLLQPARFGGQELGWDVFCEVIEILAEGCGSQAWVYRVLGDHAQMLGTFPQRAQDEVWGENPDVLVSSSFAPVGRAVPADGGYIFSGKHSFSSGVDHADWVICGGRIASEAAAPMSGEANYFLVRKSEGRVVDDWFVNGLEGTGSKSFHIENVFVASHRVLNWDQASDGTAPGGRVPGAGAIYRLPRGGYTTTAFSALLVGMARGMFGEWLDLMAKRRVEGALVAQSEILQLTAAHASMELEAAQSAYMGTIRVAMRKLEAHETLPPQDAILARANAAFSCQMILGAVHRLHECMGSAAVYKGRQMERQYRNILVGAQHVGVNWSRACASLGAHLLSSHGAPIQPPSRGGE